MGQMFDGCTSLEEIYFGIQFVPAENWRMADCTSLITITPLMENPTDIAADCFAPVTYDTAKLIVPVGAQTRYQAAEGWKEFKCLTENGEVPDTGGGTDFGYGGLDEDTPLDGNVVGNIYYCIADDARQYSSAEGCLVLRKPVTDDEMADVEGKDLFGEALRDHYTGIIFMVQAPGW